jgi:hypothetical protein
MLDFFLYSILLASAILACFVAILIVSDWIMTWQESKKDDEDQAQENQDD